MRWSTISAILFCSSSPANLFSLIKVELFRMFWVNSEIFSLLKNDLTETGQYSYDNLLIINNKNKNKQKQNNEMPTVPWCEHANDRGDIVFLNVTCHYTLNMENTIRGIQFTTQQPLWCKKGKNLKKKKWKRWGESYTYRIHGFNNQIFQHANTLNIKLL